MWVKIRARYAIVLGTAKEMKHLLVLLNLLTTMYPGIRGSYKFVYAMVF